MSLVSGAPAGPLGVEIAELEALRDEARRLEEGGDGLEARPTNGGNGDGGEGGEPACLAKVREALRRDSKPWMRGALREVLSEFGGGE